MPPITQALIVVNVAAYFLDQFMGRALTQWFALWPLGSGLFMPWQVVSYAFLHGGLTHLAFNMFGIWMFGRELESVWGPRRFLTFYFASVLGAAALQLWINGLLGSRAPVIGASGGLFGLMLGFAMLFPHAKITPLIPPIPMPAWLFVLLYGALELFLGVTGTQSGVAHFAHLGGLLGGWLMIRYWRGLLPFGSRWK
jgi:membrane associated rhomboid family serine protease